ncbi:MAG: hypothetical protein LCH79_07965 [Proteobacteria bacterium]|nr:hypothetical protein [Pseudomonadota bacterium]
MIHKTIPLKSVRDALMCAMVRKCSGRQSMDGKPLGRCAAFTQYPLLNIACREAKRGHRPYLHQPHHFGPMSKGDMERVLKNVRCAGLAEVRRTWGQGMRAMAVEFADGVMR